MRLADAWRPQEQNGFAIGDEPPDGEIPDLAPVDGGLRGEVESGEVAMEREPRQAEAHLDPPLILAGDLAFTQHGQRRANREFAALRFIKQAVELIPDGGQLQARQNPVEVVGKIGQHHQPHAFNASMADTSSGVRISIPSDPFQDRQGAAAQKAMTNRHHARNVRDLVKSLSGIHRNCCPGLSQRCRMCGQRINTDPALV